MDRPMGMRAVDLPLSPNQLAEHFPELKKAGEAKFVSTYIDRNTQSGLVRNEWLNRHLCGTLVVHRRRRTKTGGQTVDEIVPLDSYLLQLDKVGDNVGDELTRLAGGKDSTGHEHEGELGGVIKSRGQLLEWLTRTPESEEQLKEMYSGIANKRERARNLANQHIGLYADRMREIKDVTGRTNPRAVLMMTGPLERGMVERRDQLIHDKAVNNNRSINGIARSIFDETRFMAVTDNLLEQLVLHQKDTDLLTLRGVAGFVHFRHQIFNRLAYDLKKTGERVDDPTIVQAALSGHRFIPHKNFLSKIARQIKAGPPKNGKVRDEEPLEGMRTRMAALEDMDLLGPYGDLQERLLTLGDSVLEQLESENLLKAKKAAGQFIYLLNYHCLPTDQESDIKPWYGQHLS